MELKAITSIFWNEYLLLLNSIGLTQVKSAYYHLPHTYCCSLYVCLSALLVWKLFKGTSSVFVIFPTESYT